MSDFVFLSMFPVLTELPWSVMAGGSVLRSTDPMALYCCYITILLFQPLFSSGNLLVYKHISLFTKHLTLYLVGEKVTLYFLVGSKCVCLFLDGFPCFWGSGFELPRWTPSVLICLLNSFHFLRPQIQHSWAINSVWCVMCMLRAVNGCVWGEIF